MGANARLSGSNSFEDQSYIMSIGHSNGVYLRYIVYGYEQNMFTNNKVKINLILFIEKSMSKGQGRMQLGQLKGLVLSKSV